MKKLMIAAAIVCAAALSQAASVGWSYGGVCTTTVSQNDAVQFFIIGQNGVTGIDQITGLIDKGKSTASYVYGQGAATANGNYSVASSASGKTLGEGTYESFFVIFDNAAPASAENYCVVDKASGATTGTGLVKTVGASTVNVSFAAGNVADFVNSTANWKAIPEPTSGLLLLLGVAGLALRRRRA